MTAKRKPPTFSPTQRLQRAYERAMRAISERVFLSTPRKKEQTFEQWQRALALRSRQPDIQAASETLAGRMVAFTARSNYRTWREAAARTSHSRQLHAALEAEMRAGGQTGSRVRQLVRENAALISSLPLETAEKLTDEIRAAQQAGARPSTVARLAQRRFPELIKSRINLISRTETAKASTALTEARCENLSIQWYQWETSSDKRTRASHRAMHGVVVAWNAPPSPERLIGETSYGTYHAGETFNCRCTVIPILTLDDVTFPARVHWQGAVRRMTKQQFKRIAVELEERAA